MSQEPKPEYVRDPSLAFLVETTFSLQNNLKDVRRKFSGRINLPGSKVDGRIFTRREVRPKKGFKGFGKMYLSFFLEEGEKPRLFNSVEELCEYYQFDFDPNQPEEEEKKE